jgi:hypothetical protein
LKNRQLKKARKTGLFFTFSLYNVYGFPYDEVAIQKAGVALEIVAPLFSERENHKEKYG